MGINDAVISAWPNIAIDPRTGRHAATGEEIERGGQMSDETTLLPCPFCGGNARITTWTPTAASISCIMCGAHFNTYTETAAIAAWNSRAERTCRMEQMRECQHDDIECSECGVALWAFSMDIEGKGTLTMPNYCPNCGARVEVES